MKKTIGLILTLLIAGCSSYSSQYNNEEPGLVSKATQGVKNLFKPSPHTHITVQETSPKPVHYYAERLAEQFFITSENINTDNSIVVGTFLPMAHLSGSTLPKANPIAHQLQESFITIATQVGLKVVEFKTMSQIKIKNNQDVMLSRQIDELNPNINADYYLTGTYTEHKDQLVVNVRLITLSSNVVVAAATDYIPIDVMEYPSTIKLKNNQIYRGAN